MIYTLTMNPAVDMNIDIDDFNDLEITRSNSSLLTSNGKGINVSKVLNFYGVDTEVLGYFGGFTGEYIIKDILPIKSKPVMVEDYTRINIFINNLSNEKKYIQPGSYISSSKQADMIEIINQLDRNSTLVISGSLAPGVEIGFVNKVVELCKVINIRVVLDLSDKILLDALHLNPFLIKPNDFETEYLLGIKVNDDKSAIKAIETYLNLGAQNVLLTCGEKGMYYGNSKQQVFVSAPKVQQKSSACAGDGALAAFLAKIDISISDALITSSATGASIAASHGIGNLSDVDELKKKCIIRKV